MATEGTLASGTAVRCAGMVLLLLAIGGAAACAVFGIFDVKYGSRLLMNAGLGEVLLALGFYFLTPCVGVAAVLLVARRGCATSCLRVPSSVRSKLGYNSKLWDVTLLLAQHVVLLDTFIVRIYSLPTLAAIVCLGIDAAVVGGMVFSCQDFKGRIRLLALHGLTISTKLIVTLLHASRTSANLRGTEVVLVSVALLQFILCTRHTKASETDVERQRRTRRHFALLNKAPLFALVQVVDTTALLRQVLLTAQSELFRSVYGVSSVAFLTAPSVLLAFLPLCVLVGVPLLKPSADTIGVPISPQQGIPSVALDATSRWCSPHLWAWLACAPDITALSVRAALTTHATYNDGAPFAFVKHAILLGWLATAQRTQRR